MTHRECHLDRFDTFQVALHDVLEQRCAFVGACEIGPECVADRGRPEGAVPRGDGNVIVEVVQRERTLRVRWATRRGLLIGDRTRAVEPQQLQVVDDEILGHCRRHLVEPHFAASPLFHSFLIEVDHVLQLMRQGREHLPRPMIGHFPGWAVSPGQKWRVEVQHQTLIGTGRYGTGSGPHVIVLGCEEAAGDTIRSIAVDVIQQDVKFDRRLLGNQAWAVVRIPRCAENGRDQVVDVILVRRGGGTGPRPRRPSP